MSKENSTSQPGQPASSSAPSGTAPGYGPGPRQNGQSGTRRRSSGSGPPGLAATRPKPRARTVRGDSPVIVATEAMSWVRVMDLSSGGGRAPRPARTQMPRGTAADAGQES